MKDNLYIEIGKNENECAKYLSNNLKELGIEFMCDSCTNQIFPILNSKQVKYLEKEFLFEIWDYRSDDEIVVRFVTNFTTTLSHCEQLIDYFKKVL